VDGPRKVRYGLPGLRKIIDVQNLKGSWSPGGWLEKHPTEEGVIHYQQGLKTLGEDEKPAGGSEPRGNKPRERREDILHRWWEFRKSFLPYYSNS